MHSYIEGILTSSATGPTRTQSGYANGKRKDTSRYGESIICQMYMYRL